MRRCPPTTLAAVLVLSAVAAPSLAVQIHCVSNVAELEAVLLDAREIWRVGLVGTVPAIEPRVIRLQTGTYQDLEVPFTGRTCGEPPLGYPPFGCYDEQIAAFGALELVGGYGPDCLTRTDDAALTVLAATDGRGFAADVYGDLRIANLTLQGFGGGIVNGAFGSLNLWAADGNDLAVERVRLLDNSPLELRVGTGGNLRLVGNLVAQARGTGVEVELRGGTADLAFNTITDNSGSGLRVVDPACGTPSPLNNYCQGFYDDGPSLVRIVNNIIWGHPASAGQPDRRDLWHGVELGGGPTDGATTSYLLNNLVGTIDGVPFDFATGTISASPEFVLPGLSYRLGVASPARDAATRWVASGLPVLDLDGEPRPAGLDYDLGAYERQDGTLPVVTVTTLANSGPGSLRQAILDANADPDPTRIRFALPGNCTDNVLHPTTALPDVTTKIEIDGYSQPGSRRNTVGLGANDSTICVGIDGDDALAWAFHVPSGDPDARLEVAGLLFRGFTDAAIKVEGGAFHHIRGNRFSLGMGPAASSIVAGPSRRHVHLGPDAVRSMIGGSDPGDRNHFALAEDEAILLAASVLSTGDLGQHVVRNNYIGTNLDGDNDFGNGTGILISGRDNILEDNVVSGNLGDGIRINGSEAEGNRIVDNRIGLKRTNVVGPLELPNGGHGIHLDRAADTLLADNRIAHNGGDGVAILEGEGNTVRGGAIFANDELGVDLGDDGADVNDNDGAALPVNAPNRRRNYPQAMQALHAEGLLRVVGSLESIAGTFTIEVFSQDSCDDPSNGQLNGEAWTPEGAFEVEIPFAPVGSNGRVDFDVVLSASRVDSSGRVLTMIATDEAGNSSELSACTSVAAWTLFADGFESGDTSAWN